MMSIAEELVAQAVKQGLQQGLRQGKWEGCHTLLLRQMKRKFAVIPENYLKCIQYADEDMLLQWGEQLIDANTLRDIFDLPTTTSSEDRII